MPLSAAEKQKRYREKRDRDPVRRSVYLEKERTKYRLDVQQGKRKLIDHMTDREKRHQRKEWRKTKRTQRQRKNMQETVAMNTPPPSPFSSPEPQQATRRGEHQSRKRKREIAKCYRDNARLQSDLETQKSINAKLRKKLERERKKVKRGIPDTPRSKTKKLLRNFTKNTQQRKKVKRTLLFHFALKEELKEKYKNGNNQTKNKLLEIIRGKIMKKYKCIKKGMNGLCFYWKKINRINKGNLASRLKSTIENFYERDDNSRATAGIKETITRRKMKKQKRILLNTIEKLFEKFRLENTSTNVSYTTFSRLRPFWVVFPTENDRETCACKQHENIQLLADALHKREVIGTKDLHKLVNMYSCDSKNITCMYGKCPKCRDIIIPTKLDKNEEATWFQWQTKKEKRIVKKTEKEVNVTVKTEETGDIGQLVDKFAEMMSRFKVHFFNIENQVNHFRYLKENLKENEAIIHVDFSENYECKMAREIQSMHFGASKRQITLHTGVVYTKNSTETFCGVSNSLEHGPQAVWAYLRPVLDKVLQNKEIDTLHFYSDGASSQYKQKGNFYLLSNEMTVRGICTATWNFHESGHGKGVPDGVGGSLKRTGNSLVLHGRDITDAASFVSNIQEQGTSVFLYEVEENCVPSNSYEQKLKPIPGTYKIHQVKTTQNIGECWHREVSCYCEEGEFHSGHEWKFARVAEKTVQADTKPRKRKSEGSLKGATKEKVAKTYERENVDQNDEVPSSRELFYEKSLLELERCSSFQELTTKCEEILQGSQNFSLDYDFTASIMNTGLSVDENAMDIYPVDTPQDIVLYPVNVKADGNCLPYTGSILGFGSQNYGKEMRVRIIVEATIHKNKYLSQRFLEKGLPTKMKHIAKNYALYSDEYLVSRRLNEEEIENIYKRETLKITKNASYMGIWQIFCLASVLGREVFSIYPCKGNVNVRKDLHRLIVPRVKKSTNRIYIMWTSTRNDMVDKNWVPNHFVAVLPIENNFQQTVTMQTKNAEKNVEGLNAQEAEKNGEGLDEKTQEAEKNGEGLDEKTQEAEKNDEGLDEKTQEAEKNVDGLDEKTQEAEKNGEGLDEKTQEAEKNVDGLDEKTQEAEKNGEGLVEKTQEAEKNGEGLVEKTQEAEKNGEGLVEKTQEAEKNGEGLVEKTQEAEKNGEGLDEKTQEAEKNGEGLDEKTQEAEKNVDGLDEKTQEAEKNGEGLDEKTQEAEKNGESSNKEAHQSQDTIKSSTTECEVPPPSELLGCYVLVQYEEKPYPGIVLDVDEAEVQVQCMHCVGRNPANCSFYWPKAIKDICWYEMENVLAVIPEPQLINRKYFVDADLWNYALQKCNCM